MFSAAGEKVKPYVILHSEKDAFVDENMYPVKTYRTDNGYMDQKTFMKVMQEVFIPFVNEERKKVKGNKHAVLIVDGHSSRYCVDCLEILRDPINDIDLVVLPSHTSHVVQPADLGPNHYIKLEFRKQWPKAKPVIVSKPKADKAAVGRHSKRRETEENLYTSQAMIDFYEETAEETEARVNKSVYRRAKLVQALVEAIERSCSYSVLKVAFAKSHLFPFKPEPPYTREKEEDLLKQAKAAGIVLPEESARKKEHITGVLTCDSAIENIMARRDLIQYHSPRRERGKNSVAAAPTPKDSVVATPAPEDSVVATPAPKEHEVETRDDTNASMTYNRADKERTTITPSEGHRSRRVGKRSRSPKDKQTCGRKRARP